MVTMITGSDFLRSLRYMVDEIVGPMVVMIYKMMATDVLRFFIIYLIL